MTPLIAWISDSFASVVFWIIFSIPPPLPPPPLPSSHFCRFSRILSNSWGPFSDALGVLHNANGKGDLPAPVLASCRGFGTFWSLSSFKIITKFFAGLYLRGMSHTAYQKSSFYFRDFAVREKSMFIYLSIKVSSYADRGRVKMEEQRYCRRSLFPIWSTLMVSDDIHH